MPNEAEDAEAQRAAEYEVALAKAGEDVRALAKWVVGGIAATVVGILAGSPLTSLGALVLEPRLYLAVSGAMVALVLLGWLMWSALAVIAPRSYRWDTIVDGTDIPRVRLKAIEKKLARLIAGGGNSLEQFVKRGREIAENARARGATADEKSANAEFVDRMRYVRAAVVYENLLIMFAGLKLRVFVFVPVVAIALGVFAWAASPRESDRLKPYVRNVTVKADDKSGLTSSFSPDCLKQSLDVIVLAEHRSGAVDVVTVPQGECRPVRLRLDNGRLSAQ